MNGGKARTNGAATVPSGGRVGDGLEKTQAAWERFVGGAETVQGVRREILISWYRCREQYEVDPQLERAPDAAEVSAHSLEHDVVFAELGGLATSAAAEVDGLDGVVTVADPEGHILASWGSPPMLRRAADSNLAPWYAWSEWASGTNGMGTALESHHPVMVRGPEHWCRGFQQWVCAGVAVRDVVTDDPLAVLNISCAGTSLSDTVLPWLRNAAAVTESTLRQRERRRGRVLAAALADARVPPATPVAAVDVAGHVVLANAEAAVLLGIPADAPAAYAPGRRRKPQIPALPRLVRRAAECARRDAEWRGS
ncbi:MAG: DNA-binding protein, partial [Streptosporangiales bacterium]|nr:DNA-binding protein [Streptosporangiales bacterium]